VPFLPSTAPGSSHGHSIEIFCSSPTPFRPSSQLRLATFPPSAIVRCQRHHSTSSGEKTPPHPRAPVALLFTITSFVLPRWGRSTPSHTFSPAACQLSRLRHANIPKIPPPPDILRAETRPLKSFRRTVPSSSDVRPLPSPFSYDFATQPLPPGPIATKLSLPPI